eukprot:COSAG05_NODE_33_length_28089_cov_31.909289_15_plen_93_part_00
MGREGEREGEGSHTKAKVPESLRPSLPFGSLKEYQICFGPASIHFKMEDRHGFVFKMMSWFRTIAPNIHPNVDGEVAYAAPINGLAVGYIQV